MQCPKKQSSKENKRLHRSISEPSNFSELWEDLEAEPVSWNNAVILLNSRKLLPSLDQWLEQSNFLENCIV